MNKEEFVYAIGDMVRFVSEPDVKAVVTGIVMRKASQRAGGLSFRELSKRHGLQQLSEDKYRINVKLAARRSRR